MIDPRLFISWNDLGKAAFEDEAFLINPYVPRNGIVFLWGSTSVGKTPLIWSIGRAIAGGKKFMGLPTHRGKVLIIELDTPARLVADRMQKLSALPEGSVLDLLFLPPLSVPVLSPKDLDKLTAAAKNNYDLVIVNTLRKTHNLDDKQSSTPAMVYGFYQRTFPGSALLFVHHTKKSQLNQTTGQYEQGLSEDTFSGAKNFLNDAQVGLQLRKFKHASAATNLQLRIEKSQVSAKYVPMLLRLEADGSHLVCPEAERLEKVREALTALGPVKSERELDERLSVILGLGLTATRERRLECSEEIWLKRQDDEIE